jgi:hypothetical protein
MKVSNRKKFVIPDNPFHLNERLTIQQGVFLCPGDIASRFENNIRAMRGWHLKDSIVKLRFEMTSADFRSLVELVRKMNVSSAALFPGLDGVARSLGEHLFHYQEFGKLRVGSRRSA